jgi:hypothetical protein
MCESGILVQIAPTPRGANDLILLRAAPSHPDTSVRLRVLQGSTPWQRS